jgi:HEAT repeat protein
VILSNAGYGVLGSAAEALGQMGETGAKFAPEVAALLKDPDPSVGRSAAQALGKMGNSGAKYLPKQ